MVQRVIGFICLLLAFATLPSFCVNAAAPEPGKSGYIQLIFLFLAVLILLLIWELVEFFLKKKNEMKMSDSEEVISVISEEPQEEDPFRALLKEETNEYAAAAIQPKEHQEDEEHESTQIAAPQFISEPLPVVEEKKERAKRTVHLDVSESPADVNNETPPPPPKAPEEKKSVKITAQPVVKSNIDEEGWRDLMQKASKEHDDEAPRKEVPVFSKARETPREEVSEAVDEDDPWKALLKKSKQEEEVVKEEEKPWSVFLKSDKMRKGKDDSDEKDSSSDVELPVSTHGDSSVASRVTNRLFSEQDEVASLQNKQTDEIPISSPPPWLSQKKQAAQESSDSSALPPVIGFAEDRKTAEGLPSLPPSGAAPSLPALKPLERDRKRAISISGVKTDSEDKARTAEAMHDDKHLLGVREKRSIDLKTDKKKEEAGDEKKSSSKEATPLFVKKAPRVISISSPDAKEGEGDAAKKGLEISGASKEGKKTLSIDSIQKKAHEE